MRRRRRMIAINTNGSLVSHSQTVTVRKPSFPSSAVFLASRSTFFRNFSCQKLRLAFGVVAAVQPSCLCQKQPWTNTAKFRRWLARSGRPARVRTFVLQRMPNSRNASRTLTSGRVPDCLTLAINAERSGLGRRAVRLLFLALCFVTLIRLFQRNNNTAQSCCSHVVREPSHELRRGAWSTPHLDPNCTCNRELLDTSRRQAYSAVLFASWQIKGQLGSIV